MKTLQIPKKSGGLRTIYVPNEEEKQNLRNKLPLLHSLQQQHCDQKIVHGFSIGHNIVTNAMQHVGKQYTTCFDIKDFFDSVTQVKFFERIQLDYMKENEEVYDCMFVNGAARQGLPTSPLIANITASTLDSNIKKFIDTFNDEIVYTRYADDLIFSYNNIEFKKELSTFIPHFIKLSGFEINPQKTRTMSAKKGRRIITGIAVGDKDVHVPRKIKRKLRAAIHRDNKKSSLGFSEYCKLKLPRAVCFEAFESWKVILLDKIKERIAARNFSFFK